MWPFGARRSIPEKLDGPTPIDVVAKVVSPNEVVSPLSGQKAAFVHVEVLERLPDAPQSSGLGDLHPAFVSLGAIIFGDLVTFEIEGRSLAVEVVARRAELQFATVRLGGTPMENMLPELVPLLSRARRGGVICHREHLVREGERLRLRAIVERASGDRAAAPKRLVVRDDLGPVLLDEVLEDPGL